MLTVDGSRGLYEKAFMQALGQTIETIDRPIATLPNDRRVTWSAGHFTVYPRFESEPPVIYDTVAAVAYYHGRGDESVIDLLRQLRTDSLAWEAARVTPTTPEPLRWMVETDEFTWYLGTPYAETRRRVLECGLPATITPLYAGAPERVTP